MNLFHTHLVILTCATLYNDLQHEVKENNETTRQNVVNNLTNRRHTNLDDEDNELNEDQLLCELTADAPARSPAVHHQPDP